MMFSVLSFCLLTTSLVCPSVQGATVQNPRRRAATMDIKQKSFYRSVGFLSLLDNCTILDIFHEFNLELFLTNE